MFSLSRTKKADAHFLGAGSHHSVVWRKISKLFCAVAPRPTYVAAVVSLFGTSFDVVASSGTFCNSHLLPPARSPCCPHVCCPASCLAARPRNKFTYPSVTCVTLLGARSLCSCLDSVGSSVGAPQQHFCEPSELSR